MNNKFQINEVVTVRSTGAQYSTYRDMFATMGIDGSKKYLAKQDEIVKIFDIKPHSDTYINNIVYGVVNKNGDEFLIGESGLDFLIEGRLKNVDVKISEEYTAVVSQRCIKVGCQTISATKLQEIINAAKFTKLLK